MTSQLWQNRLPENRLKNDRWMQFLEVIEETWQDYLTPELMRLNDILTIYADPVDRQLRMEEWTARFLETANHLAPEFGPAQVQSLTHLKGTETLWRAYGRQLGFEEEDIIVETQFTDSELAYKNKNWDQSGRLATSRIALVLSLRNARWYFQPVSSPANLLQEYAMQTKPVHITLDPAVLQATEDTISISTNHYSGYEIERVCRVSY